ncbi:class II aldolase/adducin family protein [Krasilnikovia sp. M28-CT-15]|uniref:class II aldolase/adducin family protein n=1 Tax=Krasilnikovia sp. M28-CT-15 TaxID=3373540 RepID=UPI0038762284
MTIVDLRSARDELVAAAAAVTTADILSLSGHGNVSLRLTGRNEILYTASPSLRGFQAAQIVRIRLDGEVLEGNLPPLSAAAVQMHLAVYAEQDDANCVIHTHSPAATTYAVAGHPILPWAEPLVIFGLDAGVPVVPYARRGTPDAAANIRSAITPDTHALLLENHGVLVFHRSVAEAVRTGVLIEEAARLGIGATVLGGARVIPTDH